MTQEVDVLTCAHRWWHDAGITRDLVCVICDMGQHGIDVTEIEHECTDHGSEPAPTDDPA